MLCKLKYALKQAILWTAILNYMNLTFKINMVMLTKRLNDIKFLNENLKKCKTRF